MLFSLLCTLALAAPQADATDELPILSQIPMIRHLFEEDPASTDLPSSGVPELPHGFASGFQDARRIRMTQNAGGRSELVYRFSSSSVQLESWPPKSWLGVTSFRDRFVLDRLREISGKLKVDLVDRIESRTRGANVSTTAERAIEVSGPNPLVVRAGEYLDALTAANQGQVLVECSLFESPVDSDQAFEVTLAALDAAQYESTNARLMEGSNVLSMPAVQVNAGVDATVSTENQLAYIADFEMEIAGDSILADPVVKILQTGLTVRFSPIVTPSGQIVLEANIRIADLRRPIPTRTISIGNSNSVEVQLPEIAETRWTSADLRLTPSIHALHVRGIRIQRFDENGDAHVRELQILLKAKTIDNDSARPSAAYGDVIGVDADSGFAFVRVPAASHGGANALVQFLRNGESIGQGQVTEVQGGLAIIRIIEGEIRRGDLIR